VKRIPDPFCPVGTSQLPANADGHAPRHAKRDQANDSVKTLLDPKGLHRIVRDPAVRFPAGPFSDWLEPAG